MKCYSELGISLWGVHCITWLHIVGEMYDEFIPPNKLIKDQKPPDSLRNLFQIWGHLYTRKLGPKCVGWVEGFVLEQPSFLSPCVQPHSSHAKSQQSTKNLKNWSFIANRTVDDEGYLADSLACWLSDCVFANASTTVCPGFLNGFWDGPG